MRRAPLGRRARPAASRQGGTQRALGTRTQDCSRVEPQVRRGCREPSFAPDHWACLQAAGQARRLALDAAPSAAVARVAHALADLQHTGSYE